MRKITAAAIGFLLLASLMGCSSAPETAETPTSPTETVTVAPEPSEEPTPEPVEPSEFSKEDTDTLFLAVVRDEYPVTRDVPDATLISFAENACGALDAGASIDQIIEVALDSSLNPSLAGFMLGAGIASYCPEFSDKIEAYGGSAA